MIILDTNVVSEPMKPDGHHGVQAWLDDQLAETLYLTSISLSELLLGVEVLPDGKRKVGLAAALSELLTTLFGARVLPFDQHAAAMYAGRVSRARAAGRAISMADGQIAAIAAVHGFSVATRDTAPFVAAGLAVVNPWEVGGQGAKP
ncbi:MAG: type II toxin-antitoxin system VapC family toxin [Steroidobacteraceae bacterium]